jgi:hypothetical protein
MIDEKARRFQIAILLYPGVTALHAVGPWEILSRIPNTDVRFGGKEVEPVLTEGGTLPLGVSHTVAETHHLIWCLYQEVQQPGPNCGRRRTRLIAQRTQSDRLPHSQLIGLVRL